MNKILKNKNIVVGICGSIAAYKSCDFISELKKLGANVQVVLTQSAEKMVSLESLQIISKNKVLINTFDKYDKYDIPHIDIAKQCDALVIFAATANTLAKINHGIADNLLCEIVLACNSKVLIAPAMNTQMWNNISTKENVYSLKRKNYFFSGPIEGNLACGDTGIGKLNNLDDIISDLSSLFIVKKNKNVLVTAGASIEDIDPVRFLSNRSTGKMGIEIAKAFYFSGYNVTLLLGNSSINIPEKIILKKFRSTNDLYNILTDIYKDYDIIIQAAAPADYSILEYSETKIKKQSEKLTLSLKKNPDIAKEIGKRKLPNQIFVGFAAETNNDIENANEKLKNKNLDFIILNNILKEGAGFGYDTNIITIISAESIDELNLMTKEDISYILVEKVENTIKRKAEFI